jgi:hypothetical protein
MTHELKAAIRDRHRLLSLEPEELPGVLLPKLRERSKPRTGPPQLPIGAF